jgi:hypothetical protein
LRDLAVAKRCRACKTVRRARPVMNETPTQRELLTAHERRAKTIAQLHTDAIATANDWSARQRAIKPGVVQKDWRQRPAVWQFGAGIVLWILAVGYLVALGGEERAVRKRCSGHRPSGRAVSDDTNGDRVSPKVFPHLIRYLKWRGIEIKLNVRGQNRLAYLTQISNLVRQ